MKDIVIFEDGKITRGSRAKLVKRGNKRVLIEFWKYDYNTGEDVLVTEWFKLFIPSYSSRKKGRKYDNKRKNATYYHEESNEFYSDRYLTEEFKQFFKESLPGAYYTKLFE